MSIDGPLGTMLAEDAEFEGVGRSLRQSAFDGLPYAFGILWMNPGKRRIQGRAECAGLRPLDTVHPGGEPKLARGNL